ncbi:SET and MYND domain-containing protein 4-like isoform X2 [Microplitis mediator]|nr:SET and MYND domain-containing protein 4-like isoform X2 [Microplitis mediator]
MVDSKCGSYESLIKNKLKELSEKYEKPEIEINLVDKNLAGELLTHIKKKSSKISNKEIIGLYTMGVGIAKPDSEELATMYANRSAILYEYARYNESLVDIKRALEIGYPDKLKANLYLGRAKNLLALDNKIRPEVQQAMDEAYRWMGKMDAHNEERINAALINLQSPKFRAKSFRNSNNNRQIDFRIMLPNISTGNSKILGASDAISLKQSSENEFYVEATRDIKSGEGLLVHKSYASVLVHRNFKTHCLHCFKRILSGIPCLRCIHAIYCNENCRDKSWKEYHDIECLVISTMIEENIHQSNLLLSLRLTVKALKEAGTINGLRKKIEQLDSMDDSFNKRFTGDVFDCSKYCSVYTLTEWKFTAEELSDYSLKSAKILLYLAAITEVFGKKIDDFNELMGNQLALFIGGLILRHICIIRAHSVVTSTLDYESKVIDYCEQLFPMINYFTQSCDPNVYVFYAENTCVLFALNLIKPNDKICITHYSYLKMKTAERKEKLMKINNIDCKCVACVNDWGPDYKYPSVLDQPLPADVKQRLTGYKERLETYLNSSPSSFTSTQDGYDSLRERITHLNKAINTFSQYANYPCQELIDWKDFICTMYDSLCHTFFHII